MITLIFPRQPHLGGGDYFRATWNSLLRHKKSHSHHDTNLISDSNRNWLLKASLFCLILSVREGAVFQILHLPCNNYKVRL